MAEPPRHGGLDREDPLVSGTGQCTAWRVYHRPVPGDFARALADAFPRREGLSWLLPRWEPGDDWAPIERWVIWEVHPWALVPPGDYTLVQPALEGPNPRGTGHYCASGWCECPLKRNRWTGGASEGTDYFRQWQVAQELKAAGTPGFPRVIWIVQGQQGGHPPEMGTIEKQLAAAAGLPTAYPAAGDWPYAELDARVVRGLVQRDRLRDAQGLVARRYQTTSERRAEEVTQAQQAAEQLFDFLLERTSESAEQAAWWMRRHEGHLVQGRHGEPLQLIDRDTLKQQFVDDLAVVAAP